MKGWSAEVCKPLSAGWIPVLFLAKVASAAEPQTSWDSHGSLTNPAAAVRSDRSPNTCGDY